MPRPSATPGNTPAYPSKPCSGKFCRAQPRRRHQDSSFLALLAGAGPRESVLFWMMMSTSESRLPGAARQCGTLIRWVSVAAALDIIASALSIVEVDADRRCALVETKRARCGTFEMCGVECRFWCAWDTSQHHTQAAIEWSSFSSMSGCYLARLECQSFKGIAQVPKKL
jgi:hypothetical protein